MPEILLPLEAGPPPVRIERACPYQPSAKPLKSRLAYAAAHIVPGAEGIDCVYKTGIVFLAWLNGHQDEFRLLGGFESGCNIERLSKLQALAERAGVQDPEAAGARMRGLLA